MPPDDVRPPSFRKYEDQEVNPIPQKPYMVLRDPSLTEIAESLKEISASLKVVVEYVTHPGWKFEEDGHLKSQELTPEEIYRNL